MDVPAAVSAVVEGDRRALARLLTTVEDASYVQVRAVVTALFPHTGHARVLGVTGAPGVGKSTLVDALATRLRSAGRSVAILAVDPSSPFSGGALLGDRVRMPDHHTDAGVYIRSMAARGHLGGLASATPDAVLVLDAAGFDEVILETVGVGQSELEVAATADTTLVVVAPGMGDDVQSAKAGILEIADVFAVNKADRPGVEQLESELEAMLGPSHAAQDVWAPPIVQTTAVRAEGVAALVDAIEAHRTTSLRSGAWDRRRRDRARSAVREIALGRVRTRVASLNAADDPLLDTLAEQVAARVTDPYVAADRLLDALQAARI